MRVLTFLLLTFIWQGVLAQSNLGELLDQGGLRLAKEDLTHDILATSWVLATNGGEITYKADGTYSGFEGVYNGGKGIFGAWEIDAEGKLCFLLKSRARDPSNVPQAQCAYWFKLGDRYFASRNQSDRLAPIYPRTPKKP
jgi:hypothetical protein